MSKRRTSSTFKPSADGSISTSSIKKNSNGGVLITESEIQSAFNLIDSEKTGTITTTSLKKKLGVFFPEMTSKDYKFLLNNKRDMTVEDLNEMLIDNEITNFDPVAEAFKAFDPKGEGKLDTNILKEAFVAFGFGELSETDLGILVSGADKDGDGKINLEDFQAMVDLGTFTSSAETKPSPTPSLSPSRKR